MVAPIVADLQLDLYDLEFRGGTLRVTIDTPPGSPGGVDLDTIALVTRLISRDLDHDDPVPGHYTLEVTSPGLERTLRTPAHFQREVGKTVALRLRDIGRRRAPRAGRDRVADRRRRHRCASTTPSSTERVAPYDQIDRARTVFVWGERPSPARPTGAKTGAQRADKPASTGRSSRRRARRGTRSSRARPTSSTRRRTPSRDRRRRRRSAATPRPSSQEAS